MYLVIRCFLDKKIKKNQFLKKEGKKYFAKKRVKKQGLKIACYSLIYHEKHEKA